MEDQWIQAAALRDVRDDETLGVVLAGEEVCLYNLGGDIFATEGKCTHGEAFLAQGFIVDDGLIECPLHEGTFDIRTGAPVGPPCTKALRCFDVKVESEVIFVRKP